MNNNNQNQLWTDSQKTRYFLIPENAEITAGEFQILTIHGNEKKVDLTNIMSWEISADEASQYLQLDMNQVLETAKNAFSNLILFATSDHVDNSIGKKRVQKEERFTQE